MKKYKYILLTIGTSFLFVSYSFSQEETYRFRTFSPEGGFYYDGVTHIKQDYDGFIWILMSNDLYRFDGYKYKRYFNQFNDFNNEDEKIFRYMVVDKLGRLFVVVSTNLYMYNKTNDSFNKILEDEEIRTLYVDDNNNLWMTVSGQLQRYDEKNNQFETPLYNDKPLNSFGYFTPDKQGFFILAWGRNILRYNFETNKISLFYSFASDYYVRSICKINNSIWALSRNYKLYKIDIPTGKIEDEAMLTTDENLYIKTIHADKNENIWVATQNGLYIFDTKTHATRHYTQSKADPFSLPNNSIWAIEEDLQQNIWIGTYSGGVSYVNLDEKVHFKSYTPIESPLNHNLISGFAENDEKIWIATEGGGLNCMDKTTGKFTYHLHDPKKNSLPSNNVKSIVMDHDHHLWAATFRGGLSCYNPHKNSFRNFSQERNNPNSLYNNNLRKLIAAPDSGLWIVYQFDKLAISHYSIKKDLFTHYQFDDEFKYNYIFDMCHGSGDLLWIVTHKNLYSIDIKSIKLNKHDFGDSLLYGQTICTDADENIWIGTLGKGLIRYNTKTSVFTIFDEILKFDISSIYSICTDNENYLWLGTDNGLFRYDTNNNTFLRFDKKDGVQGQSFYPLSSLKNKSGDLYFGGSNGFTIINPKKIEQNRFKPEAMITDFYIDNISAKPNTNDSLSIENTTSFPTKIKLNHKQQNFGFTFSSNNYLVPEKNRFRYRLKGYDERWIETGSSNRSVFYSKVPPGNYTFEVIASNNDGIWSNEPTQVQIKRLPAPWFSWWAYGIYFLIMLCIAFVIIRYYLKQKDLKMQLYLDKLNKEKKEEIHQSQLRFFTNISHDFRTPLSLIIASVEKLREEGLKEYYYKILNGNSQRLLGLVNELMDFRTVENGKMPLQVSKVDVNEAIKTFAFDFKDYAEQRNIKFNIEIDPLLPNSLYVDKHILEKVTMNLLNNAFKYTKDGGSISIRTLASGNSFKSYYKNHYSVKDKNFPNDCFAVVISDTGIGISKESVESVFERFYKVKTVNFDSHLGTGIGLALVKSLVLLHKGKITIYSERDKGTDFIVCFSSTPGIYNENEHLNEDVVQPENSQQLITEIATEKKDDILKELSKDEYIKDKRRILLAEDNHDLRGMIADYLSTDYEVIEAENGQIASNLLEKMRIDLIISDIMMPEKDGITLCKETKGNINTSHIPFLLLTAKTGLESKIEGADSGADIYFEKPIDFKLLLLSVHNVFKQQQQTREYYSKNYFAESNELTSNQMESDFLKKFIDILEKNLTEPEMDVNKIAAELSMSRSKLYNKLRGITGKSIVEFILNHRLRKAARLIVETDLSMREVMEQIGIESQSYFTRAFKKEFGETPTAFAAKHKKGDKNDTNQ